MGQREGRQKRQQQEPHRLQQEPHRLQQQRWGQQGHRRHRSRWYRRAAQRHVSSWRPRSHHCSLMHPYRNCENLDLQQPAVFQFVLPTFLASSFLAFNCTSSHLPFDCHRQTSSFLASTIRWNARSAVSTVGHHCCLACLLQCGHPAAIKPLPGAAARCPALSIAGCGRQNTLQRAPLGMAALSNRVRTPPQRCRSIFLHVPLPMHGWRDGQVCEMVRRRQCQQGS